MPQTPERFGSMANKEEVILLLREEKLENVPLSTPLISHGLESSLNSGGVQCIAVLDSRKPFAACLGLPDHKSVASNSCFLQVTDPLELFKPQCEADAAKTLEFSLEDYLQLYAFFLQRWPVVCGKMMEQTGGMQDPETWVAFADNLHFMGLGFCRYSARIGEDLRFRAETKFKEVKGKQLVFMEAAVGRGEKSVLLPLDTCVKLFAKPDGYHALRAAYKTTRPHLQTQQSRK